MNRKLGLTLTAAAGLVAWALSGTVATPAASAAAPAKFIGVSGCGSSSCHGNPSGSNEMKTWQDKDPHAGAYEKLSDEKATKIAKAVGEADATTSAKCLGCHSTGGDASADMKEKTLKAEDGVSCESCHGAGSAYKDDKHQKDRAFALANGLVDLAKKDVRKANCDKCHGKIDDKMVAAGHPKPSTYDEREEKYSKFAHWKKK
ncbi:MAG TPA: multiheme c-type cytochrome [bacterium]|nr:multiheme c-type cytochrome [bacterium]